MATAIICIILIIICVFGIRSYTKRLSHGCCGGGGDVEKRVKPKDKNPNNYLYDVSIYIEGMTCSNCARRVENSLNSMEGMWAKVDSQNGLATVRMKEKIADEELRQALEGLGYTVAGIK